MSRIRTIKPAFWTDETIDELSNDAALFFIGIWNFSDDYGYFPCSPRALSLLMPRFRPQVVEPLLRALETKGLVRCSRVAEGGAGVGLVVGWDHQQIRDRRASKWKDKEIKWDDQKNDAPRSDENLLCIGKEGKGKDRKGILSPPPPSGTKSAKREAEPPEALRARAELKGFWLKLYFDTFGHEYVGADSAFFNATVKKIHQGLGPDKARDAMAGFVAWNGDPFVTKKGHPLHLLLPNIQAVEAYAIRPRDVMSRVAHGRAEEKVLTEREQGLAIMRRTRDEQQLRDRPKLSGSAREKPLGEISDQSFGELFGPGIELPEPDLDTRPDYENS